MKEQAKVVVIGGGVVGVSALYHLAKKGWGDDVVLLEKAELTSGSTWHAAGLLPLFNMSYSVGQVHKYSVNLYNQLEEETGQPVGFSRVGNLRLAMNDDRMDEYYQYAATARTIGVDVRFLTPAEIGNLWPLCNTDGLVGGIFHPEDGYIQPADLTQALAKGKLGRVGRRDGEGQHYLRPRHFGNRQLRPQDRCHGGPRYPGHTGRAPVSRDRAAPGAAAAQAGWTAGDGRAA
jgi:dimethylglycine dehydrogenase